MAKDKDKAAGEEPAADKAPQQLGGRKPHELQMEANQEAWNRNQYQEDPGLEDLKNRQTAERGPGVPAFGSQPVRAEDAARGAVPQPAGHDPGRGGIATNLREEPVTKETVIGYQGEKRKQHPNAGKGKAKPKR